jgi:crotonobetainyl-CoA:carnitine CoA-transferase CaiB-like acyl-CoA transferase
VGTGDRATAFMLAYGILGALLGRERFGIVQDVHTSMLGACLVLHGWTVLAPLLMGEEYPRPARPDGDRDQGAMVPTFRCADGRWIMISVMTDAHWAQFREALPGDAVLADPRFRTIAGRIEDQTVLEEVLTALFLTRNAGAWADLFRERAPDIYFTQVHTPADLASDSQVKLNDYIVDWDHPAWGVVPWIGFPVDWSETPAQLRSPAPEHGEHTEAILQEIGYSWDAIGKLKDDGVI